MHSNDTGSPLLKEREVEAMLKVAKGFLAKDRIGKARIPHIKIGRSVRYRLADVLAFIEASIRKSTSDPGNLARLP